MNQQRTSVQKLCQFLEAETLQIQHSTRRFYAISFLGLLGFVIYMSILFSLVTSILESKNLALMLNEQIKKNIPEIVSKAKAQLVKKAPHFADDLSHRFLRNIPIIRQNTEKSIEKTFNTTLPEINEGFVQYISEYFSNNQEMLTALAQKEAPQAFAQLLREALVPEFDKRLASSLNYEYGVDEKSHFTTLAIQGALIETAQEGSDLQDAWKKSYKQKLYARLFLEAIVMAKANRQ